VAAPRTAREQFEVYRFSWFTTVGAPFLAILFQAYLPLRFPFFQIFDLPLLMTIYFAVARRNQVGGMVTGCLIGLLQDSLTHRPIGLYGIAKTVVGYAASSLGVRIDVDNPGTRLLMGFGFYLVHSFLYVGVARALGVQSLAWRWGHELIAAAANALLAVVLFTFLDRFRQRA
jgi:rod shape-determining protein MreD